MMMKTWQLQDAKARMSELVKRAQRHPQTITVHGKPAAVLVSAGDYERLVRRNSSFSEFMRRSPLYQSEMELVRDKTAAREVEL